MTTLGEKGVGEEEEGKEGWYKRAKVPSSIAKSHSYIK